MKKILTVLLFVAMSLTMQAGKLKESASQMLFRLNAELVKYQQTDVCDPDFGAIGCSGCSVYHTRAGEAMLPLAYEYFLTGSEDRLRQAVALAEWLIRHQSADGSWPETPDKWTGTTTDQLLMLLLTYPLLETKLSPEQKIRWDASMTKAADYLCAFMNNHNASINYLATSSAALALAWKRCGNERYRVFARELSHTVTSKMNTEWFIEGEGSRERGFRYGVDIGYNLEMSLWGLALYAKTTGDLSVDFAVRKSAENHLAFIYPDGTLDGSTGVRSNKWTIYGSATSDGFHPLAALLGDSRYIEAAVRNIGRMSDCFTSFGLLGCGPDRYGSCNGIPCIYQTFTKAKSMAMTLMWLKNDIEERVVLPSDKDSCFFFQSLGTAIVRRGPFRGTIASYGYKSRLGIRSKNMFRPSGGAMTLLWTEGYGLVQASSQTEYIRWEPLNFPEAADVRPLTPRLEYSIDSLYYTNLFDFDATISVRELKHCIEVRTTGSLKDRDGFWGGVMYAMEYIWDGKSMTKSCTIIHQTNDTPVYLIEPLLWDEGTTMEQTGQREIRLERNGVAISIKSKDHDLSLDMKQIPYYTQPYPSVRAVPLIVKSSPSDMGRDTVTLIYSLSAVDSTN